MASLAELTVDGPRGRALGVGRARQGCVPGRVRYCCAVKGCGRTGSVGYAIDERMTARLTVAALETAVAPPRSYGDDVAGCIVHADPRNQSVGRVQPGANRSRMIGSIGPQLTTPPRRASSRSSNATSSTVATGETRDQLWIAISAPIERTYYRR